MPYRQAIIKNGYAEDEQLSEVVLCFGDEEPPETAHDALVSVANSMFRLWWSFAQPTPPNELRCNCCNQLIQQNAETFTMGLFEEFREWVHDFGRLTNNDIGPDEEPIWTPWASTAELRSVALEELLLVSKADELLPFFVDLELLGMDDWVQAAWSAWLDQEGVNIKESVAPLRSHREWLLQCYAGPPE